MAHAAGKGHRGRRRATGGIAVEPRLARRRHGLGQEVGLGHGEHDVKLCAHGQKLFGDQDVAASRQRSIGEAHVFRIERGADLRGEPLFHRRVTQEDVAPIGGHARGADQVEDRLRLDAAAGRVQQPLQLKHGGGPFADVDVRGGHRALQRDAGADHVAEHQPRLGQGRQRVVAGFWIGSGLPCGGARHLRRQPGAPDDQGQGGDVDGRIGVAGPAVDRSVERARLPQHGHVWPATSAESGVLQKARPKRQGIDVLAGAEPIAFVEPQRARVIAQASQGQDFEIIQVRTVAVVLLAGQVIGREQVAPREGGPDCGDRSLVRHTSLPSSA